ncbi:hypothetical protein MKZ08_09210 [Viridibacillus sp. FSL R5-0477]|uniref:Uncharacterized protein n=1 Tax=Viridibacillus arenosi FSL R5-213 TaxID=1227360 RepID=W4F2X8_9BACL|nr:MULTISPECIES: hypothetical protein [Viridibacillus]ETT86839.1 hypothetical protein C176_09002 [Viridibacillus arenosi FSL R5-213]OMC83310.1 hypothetical protein BK130_07100 [Viridibacillus sp. FSL H8-0123]OMC88220.1 hypothetical protein BK137_19335 [Viridibacillus arenosi]
MGTPIAYQRIQTAKGTFEIPLYSMKDATILDKSLKMMTHKGLACYELVDAKVGGVENSSFLRIQTHKGLKAIKGVVNIIKPINTAKARANDKASIIIENTPDYFHVSTPWAGTGLVIPIGLLVPNHYYDFTMSIEISYSLTKADFVLVNVWNATQKKYLVNGMAIMFSTPSVGVKQDLKSIRLNTDSILATDQIELKIFAANGDKSTDDSLNFKVYKAGMTIKLV